MSIHKLVATTGLKDEEWPREVKEAFLKFCALADQYDFSVLCAVGFNRDHARAGQLALTTFFSSRASANPHQTEMLQDMSDLFHAAVERSKQ